MYKARLVKGYQVASGLAKNSPFDGGTIELQKPFFEKLGLNLDGCFMGTLNLDIEPYSFNLKNPSWTFSDIAWTDKFPSETFSFSRCKILFNNSEYDGYIYLPHPETKIGHFQKKSVLEIIAPLIQNISYGDTVNIIVNQDEIEIYQ